MIQICIVSFKRLLLLISINLFRQMSRFILIDQKRAKKYPVYEYTSNEKFLIVFLRRFIFLLFKSNFVPFGHSVVLIARMYKKRSF